jgi:hypothetical protein
VSGTHVVCNEHTEHSLDTGDCYRHATAIDILPDDVLLEIFVFLPSGSTRFVYDDRTWRKLVHVCRRWRQLVFASPLRLDLQLLCTRRTPVRKVLGCWPAFPLAIDFDDSRDNRNEFKNIVAASALEQRDRVRHINLNLRGVLLGELFATMEKPFPALTHLCLSCGDHNEPAIPSAFLGGSAPRLRDISISYILLPSIPTFLFSACDLVKLRLDYIPQTSFPSPEAMVACLATLTKLETFFIRFYSLALRPDPVRLSYETRVILPSVTSFSFERGNTYLENFVACINTPRLNSIDISYARRHAFRVTELSKFIERSNLRPSRFGHATIRFGVSQMSFSFCHETNPNDSVIAIKIEPLRDLCEQAAEMTKLLHQASDLLSDVVHLKIELEAPREIDKYDYVDDIRWLELFRPFISVETLHVSFQFAESITHTFQEMPVEMVTQVLPALTSLHWDGPLINT